MADTIRRIIAENTDKIQADDFMQPGFNQTLQGDLLGVPVVVELDSYTVADDRTRVRAKLFYRADWEVFRTMKTNKQRRRAEFITADDYVLHEQGFKMKDFVNLLGSKTS